MYAYSYPTEADLLACGSNDRDALLETNCQSKNKGFIILGKKRFIEAFSGKEKRSFPYSNKKIKLNHIQALLEGENQHKIIVCILRHKSPDVNTYVEARIKRGIKKHKVTIY
jgi:hypothetical protein